jgi:hypothetical protein
MSYSDSIIMDISVTKQPFYPKLIYRHTRLIIESSVYSKLMAIEMHIPVYNDTMSYYASYQLIIKAVTKLYKSKHAHIIRMLNQLIYHTFLKGSRKCLLISYAHLSHPKS